MHRGLQNFDAELMDMFSGRPLTLLDIADGERCPKTQTQAPGTTNNPASSPSEGENEYLHEELALCCAVTLLSYCALLLFCYSVVL